jgi:hypothetical protein
VISSHGQSIFIALREHWEGYQRDTETYLTETHMKDEPDEPAYPRRLKKYAVLRAAISDAGGPTSIGTGEQVPKQKETLG